MARFKHRPPCSEETKLKISGSLCGRKLSAEHHEWLVFNGLLVSSSWQ